MLTRLKVSGFKNLVDVDVRFGPFTCVAGANGVGKSNLFDAIQFLSALADKDFLSALKSIRGAGERANISTIFHRVGNTYANTMSFEAEMIIPPTGYDDLGQEAKARATSLRYKIVLAYRTEENSLTLGRLELIEEKLEQIKPDLGFIKRSNIWSKSVLMGGGGNTKFISMNENHIRLHQAGRSLSFLPQNLPRTVLSTVTALESPTALLARNEMRSWRLLQLEPSALRKSDEFETIQMLQNNKIQSNGANLPATLYHLAHNKPEIYSQLTNRLAELIEDVRGINIDRDERRRLLTLEATDHSGTVHPAHALSDGTLRFLALAVMELDPKTTGVICLEEPENGIHPARIPAILDLLRDMATDTEFAVDADNPLRQVIINTHSPAVVQQIAPDDLLMAELKGQIKEGQRFQSVQFGWLSDTWRARVSPEVRPVISGTLLDYRVPPLKKIALKKAEKPRRIIDRLDLQLSYLAELA